MSWPGQASEHEADHGETDEGRDGSRIALEIAGEPAVAADPSEGSLDNPSLGQDDETMQFIALDDLKCPGAGLGNGRGGLGSLVAGISEDALDEGKEAARASIEDKRAPSRSCTSAEWTTTFSRRPSVSTRICRLRPVTFLPASKPCGSSVEPPFERPWRSGCR